MIQRCAWCKAKIRDLGGDGGKVSDGICQGCRKEKFPETLRTVQENAAAIVCESRKGRELLSMKNLKSRLRKLVVLLALSAAPCVSFAGADPAILPNKPLPQGKVRTENKEFWIEAGALGTAWTMDTVSTSETFAANSRRYETGGLFNGSRSVGKIMGAWAAIDVAAAVTAYEWKEHVHNKYLHPLWRVPMIVGTIGHEKAAAGNWSLRNSPPDSSIVSDPPVRQTVPAPVRVPGKIQR